MLPSSFSPSSSFHAGFPSLGLPPDMSVTEKGYIILQFQLKRAQLASGGLAPSQAGNHLYSKCLYLPS